MSPKPAAATCLAALAVLLSACERNEVVHYRVPKTVSPPPDRASPPTVPAGMTGEVAPPPKPEGSGALTWTLPQGWTEKRGGSAMRFATLTPPVPGRVDVSVTVLAGSAGGEVGNVNRWRGQLNLPPADEATLARERQIVRSRAGEVALYDFTAEGATRTRTVAGLTSIGSSTWFLKMTGDEPAVAAARKDFIRLLESLRLDAAN